MLVKRTSKNQLTLPKALLQRAGVGANDYYFDAEYDTQAHVIRLKLVRVVVEEKISEEAIERFEKEALEQKPGDRLFKSRKEADDFLRRKARA